MSLVSKATERTDLAASPFCHPSRLLSLDVARSSATGKFCPLQIVFYSGKAERPKKYSHGMLTEKDVQTCGIFAHAFTNFICVECREREGRKSWANGETTAAGGL